MLLPLVGDSYEGLIVGDNGNVDEIVMITLSVLPPSQDVSVVSKGRGV